MSEIPADLVRQLREMTGAPMMDCKRALQDSGGDIEAAKTLLRERGMAQAAKRAGRETSEGRVVVSTGDGVGTIVAVACETEPVSKNDEFRAFVDRVLDTVASGGDPASLEQERVELSAKLGENVQVVGTKRMEASDGDVLASYVHSPANKVGALVRAKGDPDTARSLALHLTFARPTYGSRDEVPSELVEAEREILQRSEEVQSKPENVRDKIVDGMLNKRFYGESVLTEQQWYRPEQASGTVAQVLKEHGVELVDYAWYSVS